MKLDGIPHIYYINLDQRKDRNENMKSLSNQWNIPMTRISATYTNVPFPIEGDIPKNMTQNEIACSISHLRAINYWLTHSDTDTALFCEDDISLDIATTPRGKYAEVTPLAIVNISGTTSH